MKLKGVVLALTLTSLVWGQEPADLVFDGVSNGVMNFHRGTIVLKTTCAESVENQGCGLVGDIGQISAPFVNNVCKRTYTTYLITGNKLILYGARVISGTCTIERSEDYRIINTEKR